MSKIAKRAKAGARRAPEQAPRSEPGSREELEARRIARDAFLAKCRFPEVLDRLGEEGIARDEGIHIAVRAHAEVQRASDIRRGSTGLVIGLAVTLGSYALAQGGGIYILAWGPILYGFARLARGLTTDPERVTPPAALRAAWTESTAGAPLDDAPEVDVDIVEPANPQHPHMELQERTDGLGTFDLWVRPAGLLDALMRRLGLARPIVDDEAFAAAYSIQTNDPDLARAWLGARVRAALLRASECSFRAARGAIVTRCPRAFLHSPLLEPALAATRVFARGGATVAAGWRGLAKALGATPPKRSDAVDAWPPIAWELGPLVVTVDVVQGEAPSIRQRAPSFTRVRVDRSHRGSAPFSLARADLEAALKEHTSLRGTAGAFGRGYRLRLPGGGELDADARAQLDRLVARGDVAAVVRDDEAVSMFLAGLVLDADVLRDAGAAASALASPPGSAPYR